MALSSILANSFGGLKTAYYLRQLFFGTALSALALVSLSRGGHEVALSMYVYAGISALLYPYARFVYESIVQFIVGDHLVILPVLLILGVKIITMFLCWGFAIFIAPVGLVYLCWVNRPLKDSAPRDQL